MQTKGINKMLYLNQMSVLISLWPVGLSTLDHINFPV